MSNSKRKVLLNKAAVNIGCSCRRIKLSSIFNPKPKSKAPKYQNFYYNSSTTSNTTTYDYYCYYPTNTKSTFSPYIHTTSSSSASATFQPSSMVKRLGRVGPTSVAVEKDSSDPYVDFRQSILQMIVENEIYSEDDLRQLLNCFLQLNSSSLHATIILVFTEILNSFSYSKRPHYASPKFNIRPKSY